MFESNRPYTPLFCWLTVANRKPSVRHQEGRFSVVLASLTQDFLVAGPLPCWFRYSPGWLIHSKGAVMFHEGLKFPFGTPRIPPSLSLFGPELTWDSAVAIWQLRRSAADPSKKNVTVAGNVRKLPNKTRRREPFQSQLQTCVCIYTYIYMHT